MSHYTAAVIPVQCAEDLVEGLISAGWHRAQIEVHDDPVRLYGYRGDLRQTEAHVVIRRQNVGPSSNDVGFLHLPDGSWQEQVSDYDRSWYGLANGQRSRDVIMQGATVARLVREARARHIGVEVVYSTVNGRRVVSIRRTGAGRSRSRSRGRATTRH